jgi:hypothetical protein
MAAIRDKLAHWPLVLLRQGGDDECAFSSNGAFLQDLDQQAMVPQLEQPEVIALPPW